MGNELDFLNLQKIKFLIVNSILDYYGISTILFFYGFACHSHSGKNFFLVKYYQKSTP